MENERELSGISDLPLILCNQFISGRYITYPYCIRCIKCSYFSSN